MRRKIVIIILVLILIPVNQARGNADDMVDEKLDYAEKLEKLGVFKGTDNGFELDREPTRIEGLVMFLRLLGEEENALNTSAHNPFNDVPIWAEKYTAYAFEKGYTNGVGEGKFGTNDLMVSRSYVTFMLRALGYNDKNGDFNWGDSLEFAKDMDIIKEKQYDELSNEIFFRGNVAEVSYDILKTETKNGVLLYNKLISSGAVNEKLLVEIGIIEEKKEKYDFYIGEYGVIELENESTDDYSTLVYSEVIQESTNHNFATEDFLEQVKSIGFEIEYNLFFDDERIGNEGKVNIRTGDTTNYIIDAEGYKYIHIADVDVIGYPEKIGDDLFPTNEVSISYAFSRGLEILTTDRYNTEYEKLIVGALTYSLGKKDTAEAIYSLFLQETQNESKDTLRYVIDGYCIEFSKENISEIYNSEYSITVNFEEK